MSSGVEEMSTIAKIGWPLLIGLSIFAYYKWQRGSKKGPEHTASGGRGAPRSGPLRTLGHLFSSQPNQSEKYLLQLEQSYPQSHPNFFHGSFGDLCDQAQAVNRPIFLVLHSPPSPPSTDTFCRDVICTDLVADVVKNNFVGYFILSNTPEAFQITRALSVTEFPSVCVLIPRTRSQMVSLLKIRGPATAQELFTHLLQTLERKDNFAYRMADEKTLMEESLRSERQLKQFQDLEYERALARDRQIASEADEKRKEQERFQKEEEERRIEGERQRVEAAKIAQLRQSRRDELKKLLPPFPSPSPSAMTVAVRLPNGKKIQRNFDSSEPLRSVIQFIDTHELFTQEGEPISPPTLTSTTLSPLDALSLYPQSYPYRVVTTHPRHIFTDISLELKQLGLGRNCILIVETVAETVDIQIQTQSGTDDGFEGEDEEDEEDEDE